MDLHPIVTDGSSMAVVGTSMVFFALTMLVGVLVVLARIVNGVSDKSATRPPAAPPSTAARPEADEPRESGDEARKLQLVALAAYGLHRRRRVAVRPAVAASPWSQAGRARQVVRFPGRG